MVVGGLNFIIEEEDDANTQIKFFFFVLLFYLLVLLVVLLVQPILFAYLYTVYIDLVIFIRLVSLPFFFLI